ncbi:hypothetical protein LX15_005455 [Streptoalloteichus tenebrarius]|uniref:Integral membrane protein n=1 Tax=Streptoalloteichus tenebrarius (strain ATCC 17920 / DSM 40477 / JCM 4838 / CBS 697.72 / NBRC 16177 / NCIMB 11028 / NRRL B-12390 / A12253. 1 / ISP 5477) TaxID=1933 RepID=A0ABT1I1U3_STRSD|nr:hypothetical protein [Streptoalloteichus tenebrarius]MCP2261729.1 hypothetical protein [Streptoalloteichus tenebrarius]
MTDSPRPDQGPTPFPPAPPAPVDHLPPAPPLSAHEAALPPRPVEVTVSFWTWIASAVWSFAAPVILVTQRDEVVRLTRASQPTLTAQQVEAGVSLAIGTSTVVAIVVATLYVLFGFKMRAGRNWARITLTVLTALGALSLAFSLSWMSLLSTLVSVVAVVLMYLPNANAYFRAQQRVG